MAYNALQKLQDNISALEIAFTLTDQDRPTDMQLEQVRKCTGFGGIKAVLFGKGTIDSWQSKGASQTDLKLHVPVQHLNDLIGKHHEPEEYEIVCHP